MRRKRNFKPKKIPQLHYSEKSSSSLDKWFVDYASTYEIEKKIGIARSTIARYKKKIREEKKSLQDIVTVSVYKKLIDLEIGNWKDFVLEKEKEKEKRKKIKERAGKLTNQLEGMGFSVKLTANKKSEEE